MATYQCFLVPFSEVERLPAEGQEDLEKGPVEKEFEADLNALQTWYKLDENNVPPVYILQPIR